MSCTLNCNWTLWLSHIHCIIAVIEIAFRFYDLPADLPTQESLRISYSAYDILDIQTLESKNL